MPDGAQNIGKLPVKLCVVGAGPAVVLDDLYMRLFVNSVGCRIIHLADGDDRRVLVRVGRSGSKCITHIRFPGYIQAGDVGFARFRPVFPSVFTLELRPLGL